MRYAIIGTGAIGGYYGGKLALSGQDVHFLARSDYKEMTQALRVDSCEGDFVISRPNVYRSTSAMPPVDVVIVALKTTANDQLPALLLPLLDINPLVILIQNGLCVEEDLAKALPQAHLAAGLAFICSTKVGPAHVEHQDYGPLTLANYNAPDSTRIEGVLTEMRSAGVRAERVDYNFGRWRKAIWNLPFNGLAVAENADTHALMSRPATLRRIRGIMEEVVAIANALGVCELNDTYIEKNLSDTLAMKPYLPSMKVDYDRGRPMEIYYLYTRAIMEADRLGVKVPLLRELEKSLLAMNRPASI